MHTPRQKNFSSKLVAVRFAIALVSFIAVTISSTSCSKGTKVLSMKQSGAESIDVNASTDADGSTSGKIIRDATTTQVLNAGAGSGVDGSQVLFPAGALAIDATVTMGLGANVASSGFAGAVGAGSGFTAAGIPVSVSSNPPTDTGNSMQIILPGPSSSSLAFWLAGDDSWIVIFESLRVSDNGKFVSGVIPRSEFKVKNGKAIVSAKNFGTYQVVIPEKPVERRLELEGKVADIAAKYVIAPPLLTRSRFFNAAFTATISGAAVTLGERFKEYRFTLDGTKPSCAAGNVSTTEPTKIEIPASESKTLKVVVCSIDGNVSAIAMATYTADNTPPATPVIVEASRSFNMPFSTTVTQNATSDVNFKEFRYSFTLTSLDCNSGAVYRSPISIPAATTTLTVIACDLAGNASPSATGTYTYDNTAPTAPSVTAANQYSSNSTVTWNWSSGGGGNGTYRYRLDNNDLTIGPPGTTSLTIQNLSEGPHTLYVQERDEAGNWSTSGSFTVTVDTMAPTLVISAPDISWANDSKTANFTVTYTGASSITLVIGNVSLNTTGGASAAIVSATLSSAANIYIYNVQLNNFTGNGTVGITIAAGTATDPAGNAALASAASATLSVDNITPSVPSITPSSATYNGSKALTFAQNATTDANFKEFRYTTNGTAPTSCADGAPSAGSYTATGTSNLTIKIVACDQVGNMSPAATSTLTYDITPPQIRNVSSTANGYYRHGTSVVINLEFSEPVTLATPAGSPGLTLSLNTIPAREANYTSGSSTNTLSFTYTISSTDNSYRLDYVLSSPLVLAQGTTLLDGAGNPAILTLPSPGSVGSLAYNKNIVIDTTPPTVTLSVLSSSNTVTPVVNLNVNEGGSIQLFSNSGCLTAVSDSVSLKTADIVSVRTNQLTAPTTTIFANAIDFAGNQYCTPSALTSYALSTSNFSGERVPLTASAGDGEITISRAAVSGASTYKYLIVRRIGYVTDYFPTGSDSSYSELVGKWVGTDSATKVVFYSNSPDPFVDTDVVNGVPYVYSLWAYSNNQFSAIASDSAVITPERSTPGTPLAHVDYLPVSESNFVKRLKVAIDLPSSSATSYQFLYKGTNINNRINTALTKNEAGQFIAGIVDSSSTSGNATVIIDGQTTNETFSVPDYGSGGGGPLIAVSGAPGITANSSFRTLIAPGNGTLAMQYSSSSSDLVNLIGTSVNGEYPRGLKIESLPNGDLIGLYSVTNTNNVASAVKLVKFTKNTDGTFSSSDTVFDSSDRTSTNRCYQAGNTFAGITVPTMAVQRFTNNSVKYHVFYVCKSTTRNEDRLIWVTKDPALNATWVYSTLATGDLSDPVSSTWTGTANPVVNNMAATVDSSGRLFLAYWQGGSLKLFYKDTANADDTSRTTPIAMYSPNQALFTPKISIDASGTALRIYYVAMRKTGTGRIVSDLVGRYLPSSNFTSLTLSTPTRFATGLLDGGFRLGSGIVTAP